MSFITISQQIGCLYALSLISSFTSTVSNELGVYITDGSNEDFNWLQMLSYEGNSDLKVDCKLAVDNCFFFLDMETAWATWKLGQHGKEKLETFVISLRSATSRVVLPT